MGATSIFALHLVIIAFNVAGCILVPLGALLGWRWVREFWWRAAHLASLAIVALQALFGRPCFLTIWQAELANTGRAQPLIAAWIDRLIYLPLPLWVFAAAYLAVFAYVVALWVWVRPHRRHA
jgi:hypothetical protein